MSNKDVVDAIAHGYTGSGTQDDPFTFEDDGMGSGGERFRKHVFEAILQASIKPDLKCIFKFGIHNTLYEVRLDQEPQLMYGGAVDIERDIAETRIMPHKDGHYDVLNFKVFVEEYRRVPA